MTLRIRSSLLLLSALALSACASAPAPGHGPSAVTRIPVQLTDAGIGALAALLRMEDARALDTALVSRHLADPEGEVRARAALAAARTGDRAAIPLLFRALADRDPYVRQHAAFGLGEVADSSAETIAALSTVALRDAAGPAAEAVHALGKIGTEAARPAIDSILAHSRSQRVVEDALLAAWRLPRATSTHDLLVRHLREDVAGTRWRAAYSLGRTGGPPAVAPLLALVNDEEVLVRANAVRGLRASMADSAGMREAALAALLNASRDAHPHVRINALNLLSAYRVPDRTGGVMAAALEDADDNVAIAAAAALQQSGWRGATRVLQHIARSARADGVRAAALHALVRTDSLAAADIATEWADSARWILRMHAARAFARVAPARSGTALPRLVRDGHYLVASEALASVRAATDSTASARLIFLEQFGAAHPLVRAAAVRGIAPHVTVADLDLLLQAYETARRDTIRDAAIAVVNALARVRRAGVPVERSFFLRFPDAPADAQLYRLIADSIGAPPASWRAPAPRTQPREPGFYEDAVRRYVAPVLAGGTAPRVIISTTHGDIELELASADAPLTVHNFVTLIERGYYRGTRWHRVVPNFVIQDGDPRGDGSGGPGYAIRDEINLLRYERGALGMALSGPDTGGSQFFITHSPQPHLDGGYTIFGRVHSGFDVVDRVVQDDPILGFRVVR